MFYSSISCKPMNEGITIVNHTLFWPVISGILLLGLVYLFKEWPSRQTGGFVRRLLLGFLALLGLAQIVLEPAFWKEASRETVILTTPGAVQAQADSLKKLNRKSELLEYVPGTNLSEELKGKAVFLLGYGLASYDLWQLDSAEVSFLGAPSPSGIVDLRHASSGVMGYPLEVLGTYADPAPGSFLFLLDPGGNPVDSLQLQKTEEFAESGGVVVPFQLEAQPQVIGNQLYYLEERDSSGRILREDPIPISIEGPAPRSILILNTFPTFETRRLKQFLTESGASVLVRSQLTRGAYKFEYINREATPLYRLDSQNLEAFQLVICDAGSLLNLSPSSRSALQNAIRDRGLALLVQPEAGYFTRRNTFGFLPFIRDNQERFTYSDGEAIIQKYPYRPALQFPEQRITSPEGQVLGVYRPFGLGRILGTVLKDTYQLPLQGSQASYNALWTALLNVALPPAEQGIQFEALTRLPRAQSPFHFQLRAATDTTRVSGDAGYRIPLKQDFHLPYLWTGTDYPFAAGWNRLTVSESARSSSETEALNFDFYTFEDNAWSAREAADRLAVNRERFNAQLNNSKPFKGLMTISPLWGFCLFLGCMGWLWLEPRLLG